MPSLSLKYRKENSLRNKLQPHCAFWEDSWSWMGMHGPLMAPVWVVAQFQPMAEQLPKLRWIMIWRQSREVIKQGHNFLDTG